MSAYKKLSKEETIRITRSRCFTDARFWHAVEGSGQDSKPVSRMHNEYRAAVVLREGDTLYFLCGGWLYELPEGEYRFVQGNVNVNMSMMDTETRGRYHGAKMAAIANAIAMPDDFPTFGHTLVTGSEAKYRRSLNRGNDSGDIVPQKGSAEAPVEDKPRREGERKASEGERQGKAPRTSIIVPKSHRHVEFRRQRGASA